VRRNADRGLALLAVAISAALSGLTLYAVARQGQSLQSRELADLRDSAGQAAADRTAAFHADLDSALGAAVQAWDEDDLDGLDSWIAGQDFWVLLLADTGNGDWQPLPLSPTQRPLPPTASPDYRLAEELEFDERDLPAALERYQSLTHSSDPLTRGRALLAVAAAQRKLGSGRAAAETFQAAAAVLRDTPTLERYAFQAELAAVDALRLANQTDAAREALVALMQHAAQSHPSRFTPADISVLEERLAALQDVGSAPPLREALSALQQRARWRAQVPEIVTHLHRGLTRRRSSDTLLTSFHAPDTAPEDHLILAVRTLDDRRRLALALPLSAALDHYWGSSTRAAPWRIVPAGAVDAPPPFLTLGEAFGDAQLVPTEATVSRLAGSSRRRLALLVGIAAAAVGAWGVVLVMMYRVMQRQRELVRLQRRFVADFSHELKTPLALIRLLAETLHEGRIRGPHRVAEYHETIARESERLSLLLDNVLDYSRIESGRKQYEFAECDIAQVARQVWTLFQPQFAADGFETHIHIQPELPPLSADGQALGQVFVNLLQNAHRYGQRGKYVRLGVRLAGQIVVIEVEDHGIGMSNTQLAQLGQSFYRAPDPRVRQTRGTGLGLAIVNHIISAHHGRLEVQSRPGKGTTFSVWLPISGARDEVDAPATSKSGNA